MLFYIFITALVTFMGYFVNRAYRKQLNMNALTGSRPTRQEYLNRILVFGVFLILFALSALRVGIGTDYWPYRDNFLEIYTGMQPVSYEFGFKMLVKYLQVWFGRDNYKLIFAVMSFMTCAFSIKGIFDTSDWFAFSVFLFMTNGFYFMGYSNVRYYFALGVAIYSIRFVLEKKYVAFILLACFAALFHKTALLVIPVYLIAYFLKWSKKTIWMIPVASVLLFFGKSIIRFVLFKIYPYYEGNELFDTSEISYVNIAKCAAILILCLIFYKDAIKGNKKAEMLFNLNLFALIIYSCGYYIPEISRICYYMVIGQIFLIPQVIMSIKNRKWKLFFEISVALAYFAYFLVFMENGKSWYILILPYITWIFN